MGTPSDPLSAALPLPFPFEDFSEVSGPPDWELELLEELLRPRLSAEELAVAAPEQRGGLLDALWRADIAAWRVLEALTATPPGGGGGGGG